MELLVTLQTADIRVQRTHQPGTTSNPDREELMCTDPRKLTHNVWLASLRLSEWGLMLQMYSEVKKKKKRKAFDVVKCNKRLGMNFRNELSYKLELLNYKCAFEVEWSHQFLERLALSSFYSSQRANVWGSCVGGQRDETEIQQPSITSYTTSQQWKALCTTH